MNRSLARTLVLSLALTLLVGARAPGNAATIDWRPYWCRVSDIFVPHFSYDCGGYTDMLVKGHMAYAASVRTGLQVIDLSDPLVPTNRGFVYFAAGERLALIDHFAFVLRRNPDAVVLVDVDDHDDPVIAVPQVIGETANDLLVIGRRLYVSRPTGGIEVHDADNPLAPEFQFSLAPPLGSVMRMEVDATRLYAAGPQGLAVYDVANPGAPVLLGSFMVAGTIEGFAVSGSLAAIGFGDRTVIVDVGDPDAMFERSTIAQEGPGAHFVGNQLWLGVYGCSGISGLTVYGLADPAAPQLLHQVQNGMRGWPEAMVTTHGVVAVAESMCWCAGEWASFYVFRPGELPPPAPLFVTSQPAVHSLLARGDLLYAGADDLVVVRDVADPSAPETLGTFAPGRTTTALAAAGSQLLALENRHPERWLQLYDLGEGWEPVARGSVPIGDEARAVVSLGDHALVAVADHGLLVVDVGDPDAPAIVDQHAYETVDDVAAHGGLVALDLDGDIALVDFGDPVAPQWLGELPDGPTDDRVRPAFVSTDEGAFLVCGNNWAPDPSYQKSVEIWDVADPAAPARLTAVPLPQLELTRAFAWHDGILYVQSAYFLSIFGWDGPAAGIELIGRIQTGFPSPYDDTPHLALAPQAVVATMSDGGLRFWPRQDPGPTPVPDGPPSVDGIGLRLTAVPNPFNPATELRFALAAPGVVDLAVYDLRGRRVRQLVLERRPAGSQAATWNGRDGAGGRVAAGVYLARLRYDGRSAVTKLVLAE